MRRSKRKVSAMTTARSSNRASASSAAASSSAVAESIKDDPQSDSGERGDISDDESSLHGPCNIWPPGADEDERYV